MRAFLFTIWIKSGKSADQTIELLEQLAAKQYSIAEQGGRYVVSATVQGKSFTYELPEDETPYDFIQLCYDAWRHVRGMTDQELEDFIVDADNEATNVTQATFSKNAYQYQSPYGN